MVQKLTMRLAPAAAVLCVFALGVGPAAATNRGVVAGSSLQRNDLAVASVGNLHGFKLAYEAANSDGSVTAVWRLKKMAIVYTGGAGSRISVSLSSRTIMLKEKTGKNGHMERRRVVETTMQVGASAPTSAVATGFQGFGSDPVSAASAIARDLANTGLPRGSIKMIAAEDGKLTTSAPGVTSGPAVRTADMTQAPKITSWCIDTLYGDSSSAVSNGCDERTKLQQATGNNYIADDLSATAQCFPNLKGSCSGFLAFNIHIDYSFPSDNQVVNLKPLGSYSDGCSQGPTAGFMWFGFSYTWSEETCNGTMTPQGLSSATNVGAYWYGQCGLFTCYGEAPLALQEVLQDHSTTHINPDSVLYVTAQWADDSGAMGGGTASCENTKAPC